MVKSKVSKLSTLLSNVFSKEEFDIIDEKYEMLTPPGEHYGSIMLALTITLKFRNSREEIMELVAKLIPASQMLRKSFDIANTFKKEVFAYQILIPTLAKFQRDFKIPEKDVLDVFSKCYGARITLQSGGTEVDEDATIVLENLKVQGYRMGDRLIGFNYDTTCVILKDLARFHATSVALEVVHPDLFMNEIESRITSQVKPREPSKPFVECIYTHSAKSKRIGPYLERLQYFVQKSLYNLKNPVPLRGSKFKTVIHRDFWVNNVLILSDDKAKPLKSKIVDFQEITCDSLTQDLIFFLFTSVINSVLDEHYSNLIEVYHSAFVRTLEYFQIDLEPYSLKELMKEIELKAPRAAFSALLMLKPVFTERGIIKNSLENFEDSDWTRDDLLGENYARKLESTVISFVKRKLI